MVATDTGIYWMILEDTGKVNILEKHTGKQVFWTNILEIYWKKVIVPPKKNYKHKSEISLIFTPNSNPRLFFVYFNYYVYITSYISFLIHLAGVNIDSLNCEFHSV